MPIDITNQYGSKNPSAKLTWKLVRQIREEHAETGMSHKKLAKKYNISSSTIGRVIRRESWVEYNVKK